MTPSPPCGLPIVSMIEHQGTIYVATTQRIYRLIDGEFHAVMFAEPKHGFSVWPADSQVEK